MTIRRILIILLITVLSACTAEDPIVWTDDDAWSNSARLPITKPIALIADTQIHESRGTASRNWSRASDELVAVTIRSAQQVIGARDILKKAMEESRDVGLTIHLGDAIDVSCETEWIDFLDTMKKERGKPGPDTWLFTPGNHDGFLVGNISTENDWFYNDGYWDNVCNVGRTRKNDGVNFGRINKNNIIESYLEEIDIISFNKDDFNRRDIFCDKENYCVAWSLSYSAPWTSYLVQMVRIESVGPEGPPIYAVLLDTSDFEKQPKFTSPWRWAGVKADVSEYQLQHVARMIDGTSENARIFFVGHHPLKDWRNISKWNDLKRSKFFEIIQGKKSLKFFITAHTHEGGWFAKEFEKGNVGELNTGSLIDPPIYLRTLEFESENENIGVIAKRIDLSSSATDQCKDHNLPEDGSGFSVRDQFSENERLSEAPVIYRAFRAATSFIKQSVGFWNAKHVELQPQLLAYADIVENTMETDAKLDYGALFDVSWFNALHGADAIAAKLRELAYCHDGKTCSVQQKGMLLYALDRYYWSDKEVPESVRKNAHLQRYCLALAASEFTAKENLVRDSVIKWIQQSPVVEHMKLPN